MRMIKCKSNLGHDPFNYFHGGFTENTNAICFGHRDFPRLSLIAIRRNSRIQITVSPGTWQHLLEDVTK